MALPQFTLVKRKSLVCAVNSTSGVVHGKLRSGTWRAILSYMLNIEDRKIDQQILDAPTFTQVLLEDIALASHRILIRSFLVRNDIVGQRTAIALRTAAERGVKVLIIKDRAGAMYEYSEENGQSFFHDEPDKDDWTDIHSLRSLHIQGRFLRRFYGLEPTSLKKNPHKGLLCHKNIVTIDDYKINDHSKVILIDNEIAYSGGINFGQEFDAPKGWLDFMLRIQDKEIAPKLAKLDETQLLDKELLNFIKKTRQHITVIMAYLGNPVYLNALTGLVNSGRSLHLITSRCPDSNRFSNDVFLRKLTTGINGNRQRLKISLRDGMVHAKALSRDHEKVRIGSQNMAFADDVYGESVVETNHPQAIQTIAQVAEDNTKKDIVLAGKDLESIYELCPRIHIIPAHIEETGKSLKLWAERKYRQEIAKARAICNQAIGKFIVSH